MQEGSDVRAILILRDLVTQALSGDKMRKRTGTYGAPQLRLALQPRKEHLPGLFTHGL